MTMVSVHHYCSLAQALNQLPNIEVVVSAPSENQSGSSHSSVGGPLTVKESKIEGIKESYSVSGRPADAVALLCLSWQ